MANNIPRIAPSLRILESISFRSKWSFLSMYHTSVSLLNSGGKSSGDSNEGVPVKKMTIAAEDAPPMMSDPSATSIYLIS